MPVSGAGAPVLGDVPGVAEEADDDGEADDTVSPPSDPHPLSRRAVPITAAVSGHALVRGKGLLADNNFRDRVFIELPSP